MTRQFFWDPQTLKRVEKFGVYLLVDPSTAPDGQITIKTLVPVCPVPGSGSHVFHEVPFTYVVSEFDQMALNWLAGSLFPAIADNSPRVALAVSSDASPLTQLLENLETLQNHVKRVIDGDIKGSKEVGRAISELLTSVPPHSPDQFEKSLEEVIQDLLVATYTANFAMAQGALSEKLHRDPSA